MEDPEWMYEHQQHILAYRDVFKDLRLLRPDITNRRFRTLANETDQILLLLCDQIDNFDRFDVELYYRLNVNLIKLDEYTMEPDDLIDMLEDISM